MRTLHRNKRKIYLCQVYNDNGIKKYHEPIELYENWQITNTDAEFLNIGLELFDYARIRTSANHSSYYHVGDRLYIMTQPPATHDTLCKTADYEVFKDPITTLNETTVWLQKLSGRNANGIY